MPPFTAQKYPPETQARPTIARLTRIFLLLSCLAIALTSVRAETPPAKKMPAPIVPVGIVKSTDVTIFETFTGTTQAHRQVDVRAQIGGILQSRNYIEGEQIAKGAPLFTIDNRPYMAALKEAQATQAAAQATLNSAQRDWARINTLFGKGVASVKDRDDAQSALEVAQAAVKIAEAKVIAAQINVDYTRINAPIAGIVGRRSVAAGNLINVGDKLAQIEAIDPIQVVLTTSADNPYARTSALNPTPAETVPAELLAGQDFSTPITGVLNFRAVSVDANTNSITLRGVFPNAAGTIKPNEFVRVRLAVAKLPEALVIPPTALTSGIRPGSFAVYVVAADHKISLTPVELGPVSDQGQVITSGLTAGEHIVTDGLVKLRPGIAIEPFKPERK